MCEGLLILNSEAETLVAIISPLALTLPEDVIWPSCPSTDKVPEIAA